MDNYVSNIWTAISAIATALMAIATFVTIYYNGKRGRKEDKRREYDERPRLVYSIFCHENLYSIKIINAGLRTAYSIQWRISSDFDDLFSNYQDIQSNLRSSDVSGNIHLCPNEHFLIPLFPINLVEYLAKDKPTKIEKLCTVVDSEKYDSIQNEALNGTIHLRGQYNRQYPIDENFVIKQYLRLT